MSLDVGLVLKGSPMARKGTGVFIRKDGHTVELTPEEVAEKWPDAEVAEQEYETDEVFGYNITHNLGTMADKAGLYEALWRPEEKGWKFAKDIIPALETGLEDLYKRPEYFKTLNPSNGWGNYDNLLEFVNEYIAACRKYPYAEIYVSR